MRLLVPPEDLRMQRGIVLSPEKSHYVLTVMRYAEGDTFLVIDGTGKSYKAEITGVLMGGRGPSGHAAHTKLAVIDVIEELSTPEDRRWGLVLCQGLLKGAAMDLVVQKASELGVREIQPLVTERSIVRETRKVPRWRKIAEESAEQSGRATVPVIHEPVGLAAFLAAMRDDSGTGIATPRGVILWEEGGMPLSEAVKPLREASLLQETVNPLSAPRAGGESLIVMVGPEGGLSPREVFDARTSGFIPVTLGRRILRADTAAIVGVALTQFILEHGC